MNTLFRLTAIAFLLPLASWGQSIGIGTATPAASAALEVSSTTQGLLLPRLTAAQRAAIAGPNAGLVVFQTDGTPGMYYYNGGFWVNMTNGRVPNEAGSTVPANGAVVTTLAGMVETSGNADGTGSAARFNAPVGIARDASGNLFVADQGSHTIRKVTPAGVVTTLAGLAGSSGSTNGTGAAARFNNPQGIAVGSGGAVYVTEFGSHTIRKITAAGEVSTLAGTAGVGGSADGAAATATFLRPTAVAVDAQGTLHVADYSNHTIRKITAAGQVSTLAGTAGAQGAADGLGAAARFRYPTDLAVDAAGNVYVADQYSHTIRKVTPAGQVSTLAGLAGSQGSVDATGAGARFKFPTGVSVGADGTVYVADGNSTIRKVTAAGEVSTLAGTSNVLGSADGTGTNATFKLPKTLTVDSEGIVYLTDWANHTIRVIR